MIYRKLHTCISNDRKFRELSDDAKLIFYTLFFHSNSTSLGAMKMSIPGLSAEMQWSDKKTREAIENLCKNGNFLMIDEKACYFEFTNFLKHNRPESPNVVKSWVKSWELIPECDLKDQLYYKLKDFCLELGKAFAEAFDEVFSEMIPKKPKKNIEIIQNDIEPDTQNQREPVNIEKNDPQINGNGIIKDLFDFCKMVLPIKPNVANKTRIDGIKNKLRLFGKEEIKIAILEMLKDENLMGENERKTVYLDIDYIFTRKSDRIAKYLDRAIKRLKIGNQPNETQKKIFSKIIDDISIQNGAK